MGLFIKPHFLTHPNRMVLLNANTDILDDARAMKIHMHGLKYLWVDAMLSVRRLINRMYSSILHGKIPFSYLYPNKSVFPIAHRVFAVHVLFRICLQV